MPEKKRPLFPPRPKVNREKINKYIEGHNEKLEELQDIADGVNLEKPRRRVKYD